MLAATSRALDVSIGVLELVLVVFVVAHFRRIARPFFWVIALMAFFALRGFERIYVGFGGYQPFELELALDALVLAILALLVAGLRPTVLALRSFQVRARERQREYERALRDYRALARHRLANPLTVILGGLETISRRDLDPDLRERITELVRAEARRLETIALDPEPVEEVEQELHPKPELESEPAQPSI